MEWFIKSLTAAINTAKKGENRFSEEVYFKPTSAFPVYSLDGSITLNPKEIRCVILDWIDLAQDRDKWRAFVNKIMKLWVA